MTEVAEFFAIDVEAADEEKGPTKKELLAALAAGDEPVTNEDYKNVFLVAKENGQDKSKEAKASVRAAELAAEKEKAEADAKAAQSKVEPEGDEPRDDEPVEEEKSEEPKEDNMLLRYTRKNGTYEIYGQRFVKSHPFTSVPLSIAERLINEDPNGFRQALPSEVADYYN